MLIEKKQHLWSASFQAITVTDFSIYNTPTEVSNDMKLTHQKSLPTFTSAERKSFLARFVCQSVCPQGYTQHFWSDFDKKVFEEWRGTLK